MSGEVKGDNFVRCEHTFELFGEDTSCARVTMDKNDGGAASIIFVYDDIMRGDMKSCVLHVILFTWACFLLVSFALYDVSTSILGNVVACNAL